MQAKRNRPPWADDPWTAERAILLQVLRDDHDARWSLAELEAEVYDMLPPTLSEALDWLRRYAVWPAPGSRAHDSFA
jgi:hypothetical protein